jgi:hypothetical protein
MWKKRGKKERERDRGKIKVFEKRFYKLRIIKIDKFNIKK